MSITDHRGDTKELRLALVCYGGSSLAIYMHGLTKEIHRLVKASRMLEPGTDTSGWSATRSEQAYGALLAELADRHPEKLRTRVVVDVVAGTSAGGINGIYLAKAVAHNRSQDALRDLWFTRGDIDELLNAPRRLPKPLRLAWVALRALRHSPLRGDGMSRWLYDALEDMDRGDREPETVTSLMPEGHRLELFVTLTDFYGYDREVPISDPSLVHDRRHRDVLPFRRDEPDRDDFTRRGNGALAFAARTTSCFPGVFPPVSLDGFAAYLKDREVDLSDLEERFFRLYELAQQSPRDTYFVDGGVLDNKPFGYAIQAIVQRPAGLEVDRRLLYLEPAPGTPPEPEKHSAPNTVAALLGAVSGIPRREPILDDLLEVVAHNERVQRIRDVVETSFDDIAALLRSVLGRELETLESTPSDETWRRWNTDINERAREQAGFGYATYIRLKISDVVDRYARTACEVCRFPEDSNHAMLVRNALRTWAEESRLFEKCRSDEEQSSDPCADRPDGSGEKPCDLPTPRQVEFLRDFDFAYGVRRLRFVIAALSWWYRCVGKPGFPSRDDLDAGKKRLYDAIETLDGLMDGRSFDEDLRGRIRACFPEDEVRDFLTENGLAGGRYVEEHRDALNAVFTASRDFIRAQLAGFGSSLFEDVARLTESWDERRRRDLVVRYLGFPFWDVLLYPIQALSSVGERDWVEVVRMSPEDARLLHPQEGEQKVKGVSLHHFGAFFSRSARENDYLWGRLDGAEHLIRILLGSRADPSYDAWCKKAFAAILDEEEQALGHVRPLIEHLRAQT